MGRFFRLRKYYYELVGSMLVVTLLPLSLVTAVLFDQTQDTVEEQLRSAHLRYLNQTVRSLELVKEQVDSSFKQLILDETIAQFETYPDGAALEIASRTATTRDNRVVSAYLETKSSIFNKINDLRLSNGFIASVYYYDPRNAIVLTDNWEQYDLDDFYDTPGLTLAQEATQRNFEWIPRVAARRYGEDRRVLSVRLPSLADGFVFLVNLHADRIYNRIVRDEAFGVRSEVFAFNRHGQPVLYDADNSRALGAMREDWIETASSRSFIEEDALVTVVPSTTLGWTFVGRTDLGSLYRTIVTLRRTFLIVTTMVLILVITAITAVSRAVYRPVGRLLDYVAGESSPTDTNDPSPRDSGEFEYITESIEQTRRDRERMSARLKESLPAYRDKMIRTLLRPRHREWEQLRGQLEFVGIDLQRAGVCALLVALESGSGEETDPHKAGIRSIRIVDTIRDAIRRETSGDVSEIDEGKYAAVINVTGTDRAVVFRVTAVIQHRLLDEFSTTATIGVGSTQETIETVYVSYREATEALKHGLLAEHGEVIDIAEIRLGRHHRFDLTDNRIGTLQDFVRSGDATSAKEILLEIATELADQHREVPYRQIQRIVTKILVALIDVLEEMGVDWNEVYPEYDAPFEKLATMTDTRSVFTWYEHLIDRSAEHVSNARRDRSWSHAEKVMEMIDADCGRNVNLDTVATQLNLNPSYLGRVFKEKVGMNFMEYLTRARIERSKQLLMETGETVQAIGKRVGYSNSYYFIRVFREQTGTTPGSFRKHHGV